MEKEHLFRAQFNGSPGSQNNKTTVKRRKYPVSSKAEYNSISEAVEEYKSNYKTLKANIRAVVRNSPEDFDFQSMTDADSFIAVSIPITTSTIIISARVKPFFITFQTLCRLRLFHNKQM